MIIDFKGKNMNLELLISILGSSFAIIASQLAMFLWLRSEANSDRKDLANLIISIKDEISEIKLENRDFHHRLLEIERARKR